MHEEPILSFREQHYVTPFLLPTSRSLLRLRYFLAKRCETSAHPLAQMMKSRAFPLEHENQLLPFAVGPISVFSVVSSICTAPIEMIPKNGEKRNFHDLEKHEMKANLGDFGVKVSLFCEQTQLTLRFNSSYIQLQCNLS